MNRWAKFFWSDWEADAGLRQCSLAAQGLWMRMLCICAKGEPHGYLAIAGKPLGAEDVAKLAGVPAAEAATLVEELERWGVFSRDRKHRIYSRRMIRDAQRSQAGKKHAAKRWSQSAENKEENPLPNGAPIGEPTTQKPEARSQREKKTGANAPGKEPARGFRLPDDWRPSFDLLAFTEEDAVRRQTARLSEAEMLAEVGPMRDWARSKGVARKDWDSTFRNWLRKRADDKRDRNLRTQRGSTPRDDLNRAFDRLDDRIAGRAPAGGGFGLGAHAGPHQQPDVIDIVPGSSSGHSGH